MDLLRLPIVGALARRRHARLMLQLPLLALAALLVVHGLAGPSLAPRNLATVLTWVHYRGLLIVAVLAVGNLFCTGCPMILARDGARRLVHARWRWPRLLRNKWPAIVLFVAVLFAYELFDLWSLPAATAWLIIGYFGAAVAVDVLFSGASFCKYVCPVGQFSLLCSTVAPTELQVRDRAICGSCRTVDCIKGRREPIAIAIARAPEPGVAAAPRVATALAHTAAPALVLQRGCELGLFLPGKVGNLDCTLCLDCVHACPHDNIGLMTRVPGDELAYQGRRSGIGRVGRRADIAALVVVFTFGALVNAFAMTAPAASLNAWLARVGLTSQVVALELLFLCGLVVAPAILLASAAAGTRLIEGTNERLRAIVVRLAPALIPLGAGIWLGHYAFHFLTGALTAIPVTQSAVIDLTGRALAGEPLWTWVGLSPGSVFPMQLGSILLGAAGSLAAVIRLAGGTGGSAARRALPWIALIIALAGGAMWILFQPMDMRGMGIAG